MNQKTKILNFIFIVSALFSLALLSIPAKADDSNLFSSGIVLKNNKDSDFLNAVTIGAGVSSNYKRYLNFINTNNVTAWRMGVNRNNEFIIYDNSQGLHIFYSENPSITDGRTVINANNGSASVNINRDKNSGTGGLDIWSGGANPVSLFKITGALTTIGPTARFILSRANPSSAINLATSYIHIGGSESALNSYRIIGFGYSGSGATNLPAYIGYQETSTSAYTKGDLIFGTRNSNSNNVAPSERLRITSDGNFYFNPSGTLKAGILNATEGNFGKISSNGNSGLTKTVQVRNADNTGNCSLIFSNGLYIGGSC